MPPRKREEIASAPEIMCPEPETFLRVGQIVSVVFASRTHTGYEVLGWDDKFIKFRGSMLVAPQTEIVLVPFAQIEAIGLTDER